MVQALNLKFQVVHHAAATHLSRRIFWNPMFIAIIHFISLFGCQPFASEKILISYFCPWILIDYYTDTKIVFKKFFKVNSHLTFTNQVS